MTKGWLKRLGQTGPSASPDEEVSSRERSKLPRGPRRQPPGQLAIDRSEPPSTASARRYAVEWLKHNLPEEWEEGEPFYCHISALNSGSSTWGAGPGPNEVNLVLRVNREIHSFAPLPHDAPPGARVLIGFTATLPKGVGDWELLLNFVHTNVAWFERQGVRSLRLIVRRRPSETGAYHRSRAIARQANWAFYTPSQGVPVGRDGRRYPVLIERAEGARITDPLGTQWIDWVMGYGSSLLGYGHPAITAALSDMLRSSAVLSLPHVVEMEVTQQLLELIPCAELVLFGKNGSDCCTAAVRAARITTGRSIVLFSGYHGWQEPFAQTFEPALSASSPQSAFRFNTNDLDGFSRLVRRHSGRIAAVMLEPAAQVEGVDGPVRDVDRSFLRHVAEICRDQKAVLIFDEILTGFRTQQGSVQQATGVTPDLAVFGKALAAGMPLSVLVGREAVLRPAMDRIFYHPTFKSDAFSLAAAAAALNVYRSTDVAASILKVGRLLKNRINEASREIGAGGEIVGLPYRMVYRFNDLDQTRRTLKRTLLQQELVKSGVLAFRGFMMPSLAHTELEVEQTVGAFRTALAGVQRVESEDSFVSALEIPLIV